MSGTTPQTADWRTTHAPGPVELEPLSPAELHEFLRGGEVEADLYERALATATRAQVAIDLAIAEGLAALRKGDRLPQLGCHLDDYAREVLGIGKRTAQNLARLGRELGTRPVLRDALRSGRVKLRAAETVLPVAFGDAEAGWVEWAALSTVRELEAAVRRARNGSHDEEEEDWFALRTHVPSEERALVDAALELAGEIMPGSSRVQRLEAIAQEYLGEPPGDPDTETVSLDPAFRKMGPREASRRAVLEVEMERWSMLPDATVIPAPDVEFPDTATAAQIDATLRDLAAIRARWDEIIGFCSRGVRKSRIHRRFGFDSFRHYCEERLGVSARAVEQRAALEDRLWESPALREARRQKLPYVKLRLLAKLPEADIASWMPRAHALTCIELTRAIEGERERHMRARATFVTSLPRRIAVLLAAAIGVARERVGAPLPAGKCLAVMAAHFIASWSGTMPRSRSRAQKIRDRDGGRCLVPGCSHHAGHTHHFTYRSQGGTDDPANQGGICPFHHLRCIHGGYLRAVGRAPDELTWVLGGKLWKGPGL